MDLAGEPIKGAFYEAELQKVKQPEDDSLFAVESVLKTRRKRNGRGVEYLVKWQGYPDKFNSWTDRLTKRVNELDSAIERVDHDLPEQHGCDVREQVAGKMYFF